MATFYADFQQEQNNIGEAPPPDQELDYEHLNFFRKPRIEEFVREYNAWQANTADRIPLRQRNAQLILALLGVGFNAHAHGVLEAIQQLLPLQLLRDTWFMKPLKRKLALDKGSANEGRIPIRLRDFISFVTKRQCCLVFCTEVGLTARKDRPWLATSADRVATNMCRQKNYATTNGLTEIDNI